MLNRSRRLFAAAPPIALALALSACGDRALTTPEALPIRTYPPGPVRLTLVMESCSDTCSEYKEPTCEAKLVEGENTVELDIRVPYDDKPGTDRETLAGCGLTCGPSVLAHCDLADLSGGTYTVKAGSFTTTIEIK